jgi:hypothetical protein
LLNLALLAALGALGWQLRLRWLQARERERAMLNKPVKPAPIVPPTPVPTVPPVTAANYFDVAQKMLFSKDRNPTVVIEKPAPPPPKPMPPLPLAHGYMNLGEPTVILSEKPGAPQKIYHEGDTIGEFKLVAVNNVDISFEWDGKVITEKLAKLRPKEAAPPVQEQQAQAAANAAPAPAPTVIAPAKPGPGASMGGDIKACVAGDSSPPGTVVDGMKKIVSPNPFAPGGQSCRWEPVK